MMIQKILNTIVDAITISFILYTILLLIWSIAQPFVCILTAFRVVSTSWGILELILYACGGGIWIVGLFFLPALDALYEKPKTNYKLSTEERMKAAQFFSLLPHVVYTQKLIIDETNNKKVR